MESFALIIFGITSNLAQIKLIPTLLDMEVKNLFPENASLVGSARKPLSRAEFEAYLRGAIEKNAPKHMHPHSGEAVERLIQRFSYVNGDLDDDNFYTSLTEFLTSRGESCDNRIFHLATNPDLFKTTFEHLQKHQLNKSKCGWTRILIEKPLGHNLESAKELNELLATYFDEEQVYRLDHYLGKETLQNILTFRFGNGTFEPLMNNRHVDHIQITLAEDFGIGGRAAYYDNAGALRDVGQNHLLQMLAFATMNAPAEFTNAAITHERLQVLHNLTPQSLVLGQYQGYTEEMGVRPHSDTDTYFALRCELSNERWSGVPLYLRSGQYLPQTAAEISIVFKNPENRLFGHLEGGQEPNVLIFRIQPNEAVVMKILVKKPSTEHELEPTYMQFCYRELATDLPQPYEKLFLDAIRGDQTFFTDAAEVEAQWVFIDALLKNRPQMHSYAQGSWGPEAANDLIQKDGRSWLPPSMAFCKI